MDNPRLRKGLDALTSSLNHIGDTIGNALEVKVFKRVSSRKLIETDPYIKSSCIANLGDELIILGQN